MGLPEVSTTWVYHFINRHDNPIQSTPPQVMEESRLDILPISIHKFFYVLKQWSELYRFPKQLIFNYDETWITKNRGRRRFNVLVTDPDKAAMVRDEPEGKHITVGGCISAAGVCLPIHVILPLRTLPPELDPSRDGEFEIPCLMSGSDTGWQTQASVIIILSAIIQSFPRKLSLVTFRTY